MAQILILRQIKLTKRKPSRNKIQFTTSYDFTTLTLFIFNKRLELIGHEPEKLRVSQPDLWRVQFQLVTIDKMATINAPLS